MDSFRKLPNRRGIAPGKALFGSLLPRQPHVLQVLLGRQCHRHGRGQFQTEDVLRIVRGAGCVTAAPARKNLELILLVPISSGSFSASKLPVTDCQKPGRSARSISSTRKSAVCITTSTEIGIL
jgi:hypothetical protein